MSLGIRFASTLHCLAKAAASDSVHPNVVPPGLEAQGAPTSPATGGDGQSTPNKGGETTDANGGPDGTTNPGRSSAPKGTSGVLTPAGPGKGNGKAATSGEQASNPAPAAQVRPADAAVATPSHDTTGSGRASGFGEAGPSLGQKWSQRGRNAQRPEKGPRAPGGSADGSLRSRWEAVRGGTPQPAPTETAPTSSEAPPEVPLEERDRQTRGAGDAALPSGSDGGSLDHLASNSLARHAQLVKYRTQAIEAYNEAVAAGDHDTIARASRDGFASWVRSFIVDDVGEAEATKYDDLLGG